MGAAPGFHLPAPGISRLLPYLAFTHSRARLSVVSCRARDDRQHQPTPLRISYLARFPFPGSVSIVPIVL